MPRRSIPQPPRQAPPRSGLAFLAATLALALLASCNGPAAACRPVPLAEGAARDLEDLTAHLDFTPVRPCAFDAKLGVEAVFIDHVPGNEPRIHFEVTRVGVRTYLLSHTRASLPFSAIPQGSHRLRTAIEGSRPVEADGFAGPAGTGDDIAYLRWRVDGVTSELAATLSPAFTENEVRRIARALMADVVP